MAAAPLDPERQRLLALARRDPEAAGKAASALPVDAQIALVCETPVAQRAALLGALDKPEEIIPALPEAELCFTVKALGLADAGWILEHATPEQVVASLDLDVWKGHEPDLAIFGDWLTALASSESRALVDGARAIDPELLVLHLQSRLQVWLKPAGDEDWQPPAGSQTLEGQFYFTPLDEGDDAEAILTLLHSLFDQDYWTYFRLMQGAIWELSSDLMEWSLRWRTGRLEDLGFPPSDEAMRIYRFIAPGDRARLDADPRPLDVEAWRLPIWLPGLPATRSALHRVFRAAGELDAEERRAFFYAFVALANKVAVADRMPLSDAESTPQAIEKAARFASEGLAHVAAESGLPDATVLRRVSVERLFAVGANLDPASARP
jgi:hypothetical protein